MRRRPISSAVTKPSCCRKRSFARRFVGRHGDHVDGEHHAPVEIGQFQDHAVFDVAGIVLEKQDAPVLIAHLEIIPMELQAIRTDRVLEVVSTPHGRLQVERKRSFLRPEESAQHIQSLGSI